MKLNGARVIIERTVKGLLTFTADIISNRQVIYSSLFSSAHRSSAGSFRRCFKFLSIWFKLKENTIKSKNDVTDLRQDTLLSLQRWLQSSRECFYNTATSWNLSRQRNTVFWYWNSHIFHLKYLWLHKLLQPEILWFFFFFFNMDFSACVYVQQQTLGILRHIALSKDIQTYRREDYAGMKYK